MSAGESASLRGAESDGHRAEPGAACRASAAGARPGQPHASASRAARAMKHIPVLEDGPWKTVCVKELNGLKKLKRKGKEPARRANGYKTFRLDLDVPELGAAATNGLRDRTQRLQPVPTPVPAAVAPAVPSGGGPDTAGERGGARAPEILDARKRGFSLGAVGPGLPTPPPPPPAPQGQVPGGPEVQPFREPALRPRILLCAPPARPMPSAPPAPPETSVRPAPPTRPGESSYSSISHVIYNNHPDSSASPRKRPGEATAASSEIKALQQTRRLLANARERTRVHTISAAFEALRKQVPAPGRTFSLRPGKSARAGGRVPGGLWRVRGVCEGQVVPARWAPGPRQVWVLLE